MNGTLCTIRKQLSPILILTVILANNRNMVCVNICNVVLVINKVVCIKKTKFFNFIVQKALGLVIDKSSEIINF